MKPKVSAVVTHYNQQEWLPDALNSLATQTSLPFEIIIIDDGSTFSLNVDMARYVLGKCRDRATIVHCPHRGVGAALNAAISIMRGDVFCWLPADDVWLPHKLERQEHFASLCRNEVAHSFCEIWQGHTFDHIGKVPELSDAQFAETIRHSSPYYANTFWIPRHILDRVGPFREDVPASEDYQWVLRSVIKHRVKYRLQTEALTVKRWHSKQTSIRYRHDIPALVKRFNQELETGQ